MAARLQRWIDTASMASPQRWAFGAAAVGVVAVALFVTLVGTHARFGWFATTTVVMAAAAAVQAGSHTAIVVVALVVVQWLSASDDVTTVRSLAVSLCLLAFHALLALMAVTPHRVTVHGDILRRWAQRFGAVAAATTAIWVLVRVLERRESPASPQLTLLALLAAGAGVVALLRRSVDDAEL
jgi:hypothetical protein